ncbi:MAG: hypothetical protein IJU39_04835 [Clostridia bacterium]|nr:hypothetical protein [Clostridia bacterium]
MNKNFSQAIDVCEVTDGELDLINSFAVKPLKRNEVFTFNVVLCDNEIDRDIERFDTHSLEKLAGLFVGKPGIFDHSMKSSDQTARIFDVSLVRDSSKRTSFGETYCYLKAKAYMPLIDKNADLVKEIVAGIKKEVSINCSVAERICSVCKKDARSTLCSHEKGKKYGDKICHHILKNPTDAYEWSFVAVPAQKNAGITKSFKERTVDEMKNEDIYSILKSAQSTVTLSKDQSEALLDEIEKLKKQAKESEEYRAFLKGEVMRLSVRSMPCLAPDTLEKICESISLSELKKLKKDFEAACESDSGSPRLAPASKAEKADNNSFLI